MAEDTTERLLALEEKERLHYEGALRRIASGVLLDGTVVDGAVVDYVLRVLRPR